MGLQELNEKLLDLINTKIDLKKDLDKLWKYNPQNPNYINPLTQYNNIEKLIDSISSEIEDIRLKISTLENRN